jgi:S-disulfanyl-L-cysteine oxidoreductase SoxD
MKSLVALALAVSSIAVSFPSRGEGSRREPSHTVWDSVYTDSQTLRGDSIYKATCARCHGAELKGGDDGSPLAGDPFFVNWEGKPLAGLFDQVRNSMPPDNPKSLTRAQTADVVAYLLARNRFPSGKAALTDDSDRLNDIKIVQKKP